MTRLYLLTDRAGTWPLVTQDELAEHLAGGAVTARLVGCFADDSEGWTRLGDEISRLVAGTAELGLGPVGLTTAAARATWTRPSAPRVAPPVRRARPLSPARQGLIGDD